MDGPAAACDTSAGVAKVEEVAKFLRLSRAQIYNLLSGGKLESVSIGKSRRVLWASVHDLLRRSHTKRPTPTPTA